MQAGNVTEVQIRVGLTAFDVARRPIVIARLQASGDDVPELVAAAKEASGQGADFVAVPAAAVTEGLSDALAVVGMGCIGVADTTIEIDTLVARKVAGVLWQGRGPGRFPASVGPGELWVVDRDLERARPGATVLVGHLDLDRLGDLPPGTVALVDLPSTGRAEAAALVTVALEKGAVGFLTSAPSAVRRAAHVIRAVELAE